MADRPARDPITAIGQRMAEMQKQIDALSTQPLTIPVLMADPGTSYAGNIWAFPDGKLNVRLKDGSVVQYAKVATTANTGTNPTPPAQPITRQATWTAQWAQAYSAGGGFSSADNSKLFQGNGDSVNGRQRSLIGFDYAAIATALAGSNVTGVRLWLYMADTWWDSGATFWMGMHTNSAKPGTFGGTFGRDFVTSGHVPASGGVWLPLATEFGARLRDGSSKGITLQAPNDDRQFYGYAWGGPGTGANQLPLLEITYVK